jgi:hypothetical protein
MSFWIYPILNELSFVYRGLFLLGSTFFMIGLYLIGEMYTLFLTSKINYFLNKVQLLIILGLRVDKSERKKKEN